jgi:uncharacterized membrane protein
MPQIPKQAIPFCLYAIDHLRYLNSGSALMVYSRWIIIIFIAPGLLVAIMLSGNVHIFEMWTAALANFVFYFALVYGVLTIRQRARMGRPANPLKIA